ncbi:MAG: hypothetical protein ACKOFW_19410, partial [Planctomycetaceae bacterium]
HPLPLTTTFEVATSEKPREVLQSSENADTLQKLSKSLCFTGFLAIFPAHSGSFSPRSNRGWGIELSLGKP